MAGSFHCETTFSIPVRNLFILVGEVIDGTLRDGMSMELPQQDAPVIHASINSIEIVSGPKTMIGVALRYASDEELATFEKLRLEGTLLKAL